jgi:hypothetical protein
MQAEKSGHFRGGGDDQMGVLSIGKLVAGQEAYYDLQVAHGRDDYCSGRGEAPGRPRPEHGGDAALVARQPEGGGIS